MITHLLAMALKCYVTEKQPCAVPCPVTGKKECVKVQKGKSK